MFSFAFIGAMTAEVFYELQIQVSIQLMKFLMQGEFH